MPFEPGKSGNPAGFKKEKRFMAALDRAIAQDDGQKLRLAAEKLLNHAADGQPWAIGMLADRLDGRATEKHEHSFDTSVTEGLSLFAAFVAEAAGRKEGSDAEALGAGGPVLPPAISPTTH